MPRAARRIQRIWHGRTRRADADAYEQFLVERAIPDYRSTPGNLEVRVLRRDDESDSAVTHFLAVTLWESEASIRAFAGNDLLRAKYYPEDERFLLEFEERVRHYEVVAEER